MGLRETLNENPGIATGVTIAIILIVVALMFRSGGTPTPAEGPKQAYFSDDDGKTFFAEDATKVPPFDRGGKQAVRAHVYRCGGDPFVNHLERYTPEAKKKAEEIYASGRWKSDPTALEAVRQSGMEVKAPGQGAWVKLADMNKAQEILKPKCQGGGSLEDLEVVYP